jgi:hypothetical protein
LNTVNIFVYWNSYCPTIHNHFCSWGQVFVHSLVYCNAIAHSLLSPLLSSTLHWTELKTDWLTKLVDSSAVYTDWLIFLIALCCTKLNSALMRFWQLLHGHSHTSGRLQGILKRTWPSVKAEWFQECTRRCKEGVWIFW